MIIKKINIKSFGMLTDTTLEFSEGINVIEGQNEAGKSTIAAFIKYMLYGFDGRDDGVSLTERRKRLNWHTDRAEGSMVVSVKDKEYLITRSTTLVEGGPRPTYKEENAIIDLETGSPAFGKVPAGEVFFGVDRELFENTAFIGQIGDSSINEGTVKESIENILFSGSERINNQRAQTKVSVKMESLLHAGGMGGVISDLMRRRDDMEAAFERAAADNKEILLKEARLHELRESRQKELDKQEKLCELDVCYRNHLIIQDFDRLHELEAEYEAKCEEYSNFIKANERSGFVPTSQYLTDIAVARRGVDDAYHNLVDARAHYNEERCAIGITHEIETAIALSDESGGERELLRKAGEIRKNQIKSIAGGILGILVAIGVLVVEIAATGALATAFPRIAFGILGAGALALIATMVTFFMRNKTRLEELEARFSTVSYQDFKDKISVIAEARAKRDGMIRSTENARIREISAKEQYERAKSELLEVIVRWGEEPPETKLNEFLDNLENKTREFLEMERIFSEGKSELELKVRELRAALSDKSEIEIRGQVSPFKRKVVSEVNYEEIIEGIGDCKVNVAALDAMIAELEEELSLLHSRTVDPGELYSKIQATDTRIEELKNQHKAYYIALKAIENASDNLREEVSPRLGEYATELMEIMTNKKYSSFDVTDGLKVTFKDKIGLDKSVDFLSGGTRDLTYIALRMALVDMLYTEKPPVCFDESFAHQDNLRAQSMMKAIHKLAEEGQQSIIFTCRAREGTLAAELSKNTEIFKLSSGEDASL